MDEITLVPASLEEKPILENLMHLYLYDFTEYTDEDADGQGRFTDKYLPFYWIEPNRFPLLVRVNGKPAGFVLVRDAPDPVSGETVHHVSEFFIMRKYRRRKIGSWVAVATFNRFPGRWVVSEEEKNLPAQAFWRTVIGAYTGGQFEERVDPEENRPYQVFHTPQPQGKPAA